MTEYRHLITALQEEFVSVSLRLKLGNIWMGFDPKQWEYHIPSMEILTNVIDSGIDFQL